MRAPVLQMGDRTACQPAALGSHRQTFTLVLSEHSYAFRALIDEEPIRLSDWRVNQVAFSCVNRSRDAESDVCVGIHENKNYSSCCASAYCVRLEIFRSTRF